jgi:hypothetical protein
MVGAEMSAVAFQASKSKSSSSSAQESVGEGREEMDMSDMVDCVVLKGIYCVGIGLSRKSEYVEDL